MASINPYIHFNGNAETAFLFYRSVFGGEFARIVRFKDIQFDSPINLDKEAEKIIDSEFTLLKNSFKLMEVEDLLADIRLSMENIRTKEALKATSKLSNVEGSAKIIDNMSKSIVNKIFHDMSLNIKKVAEEEDHDVIKTLESIFK